jgi:hypothetical protein
MEDDGDKAKVEYLFGHACYLGRDANGRCPRYCDNDEEVDWPTTRPCAKCGQLRTPEGHDPELSPIFGDDLIGQAAAVVG